MNPSRRVTLFLSFVMISVFLAASPAVAGSEVAWIPDGVLTPRLKTSSPGERWRVRRITRAGRKEFLALLEHDASRFPKWLDEDKIEKEKRERGVVSSVTPEELFDNQVLAIVNDRGKILYLAQEPSAAAAHGDSLSRSYSVPLVMDMTPTCPYAILDTGGRTLLCYDYQLAFKGKKEIPLDDVRYPKVTFDGENYTLWLFGKRSPSGTKIKRVSDWVKRPPERAKSYGVRFSVRDGSWSPLPIDPETLLRDLERIARGPEGEKLKLQPASVSITPFRDLDADEGFWVLIEAVAGEKYESQVLFSGTRVFFRSRLDSQGLGKIEQIPLWIIQEERQNVVLDEKSGVLRFPKWTLELDSQPFSLGKNDALLTLRLAAKTPEPDGSYGRVADITQVMLLFSGTQEVRFIPEESLDRAERGLSDDDLQVIPLSITDRVGKSEFAFRSLCRDQGHRVPCLSFMSLDY